MSNQKFKIQKGVTYRGLEGDYMICDYILSKSRTEKNIYTNEKVKIPGERVEGAKIKIDTSNSELLNKIKSLKRRRKIWIQYETNMFIATRTEDMLITNVMTTEEYLEFRKPHDIAEKKFDALNRKMLLKYKNQIKNLKKEEQI